MARSRRAAQPLFPRGPGLGFRTLLLLVLSFGLWFADQRSPDLLLQVRGGIQWLLQPVQWLAAVPQGVSNATAGVRSYQSLLSENRQLKEEQLKQQARLLRFAALEAENRRIRQLLASSSALEEKVLIAEIVATSQDPYRHQISLNKGARDGVYLGQALVDAYGVMGQVIRVYPTGSTAMLITDPGHGIPVEINRTGLQTIARGGGDGRVLSLPFLPGNADVKVGDLLVSSSLGGRFPGGYPVGEIFDVRRTTGEHFMQASAYPAARLDQGRQALLVWSERPEPALPAAAEAAPTPGTPGAAAATGAKP
ncbi:rod shape-determining protein MreC [Stagnimonas aquatica]|uniref:Cell shape-determining protein MreC n=1 Tax=Stagnimonas aquatica TaxID=2689987 RepID=A0A3N0V7K4_9GAMM|nr:rod shape-determining protein MreC [Stagnimonas aquatica]ROH88699.1 rod shape-determining protein MreC [Stagnimonas aquatica]